MGVLADGSDGAASPATTVGTELAAAMRRRLFAGPPATCARVQTRRPVSNGSDLREPVGGLTGSYILINATTGVEFAGVPVALQNFYNPPVSNALYSEPGEHLPDLSSVTPARSVVITDGSAGQDEVIVTDWTAAGGQPVDAVSAVLMRSSFSAEFDRSDGFATDMIVTMPTKRFYVRSASAPAAAVSPISAIGPFANTFASATTGAARSCDRLFSAAYSRSANPHRDPASGVAPLPGQPRSTSTKLVDICYASTLIGLGLASPARTRSLVFASTHVALPCGEYQTSCPASQQNAEAFSLPPLFTGDYPGGWVSFWPTASAAVTAASNHGGQFISGGEERGVVVAGATNAGAAIGGLRNLTAGGKRFRGLPVIGFTAIQATLGGQGYGGIFDLKYTTNIAP